MENFALYLQSREDSILDAGGRLHTTVHVYMIFCQPEVASDVISSGNVQTVEGCVVLNFEAASVSSFSSAKSVICVMRRRR